MILTKYEIGKLLSDSIDIHTVKTDEHTKGVFFTDCYGYVLNKIWGVRIKHQDAPCDSLFYSFVAEESDGSAVIEERYPFVNMKLKPKKHHLLFNSEELKREKISQIFHTQDVLGTFKCSAGDLYSAIPDITNRRDREKTVAKIHVKADEMKIHVFKHLKNVKKHTFSESVIKCFYQEQENALFFSINAFTLKTVLSVFSCYNSLTIVVEEAKINLCGEENPDIEVIIAKMK